MKYDWNQLKHKYVTGNYKTLKEFSDREKISYNTIRDKSHGWAAEKRTNDKQKTYKIIEKTVERQINSEIDINNRHLLLYDKILNAIDDVLTSQLNGDDGDISIYKLEKIAQTLQRTQMGQRLALGMDKDSGNAEIEKKIDDVFSDMRKAFYNDKPNTD
ncbi:MAG: hypothetical protein RR405_01520 [Clostridia bacterium]